MLQSILAIFRGQRPDVTPAQVIAGIPILAELLHSFGIYNLSQAQQDSLTKTALWGVALIGGDTLIRAARSHADAKVKAAALTNPVGSQEHVNAVTQAVIAQLAASGATPGGDAPAFREPTDEEEFAPGTGPDDVPEAALETRAPGGPPSDLDVEPHG